jgi:hypothetical protein
MVGAAGEIMKIIAQTIKIPVDARTALDDDADPGDLVFNYGVGTDSCTEVDTGDLTFFLTLQQVLQALPDGVKKICPVHFMFDRLQQDTLTEQNTVNMCTTHINRQNHQKHPFQNISRSLTVYD